LVALVIDFEIGDALEEVIHQKLFLMPWILACLGLLYFLILIMLFEPDGLPAQTLLQYSMDVSNTFFWDFRL